MQLVPGWTDRPGLHYTTQQMDAWFFLGNTDLTTSAIPTKAISWLPPPGSNVHVIKMSDFVIKFSSNFRHLQCSLASIFVILFIVSLINARVTENFT